MSNITYGAATLNITARQNDFFDLQITLVDKSTPSAPVPVDLTGYTAKSMWKKLKTDTTALVTFSEADSSLVISDPTNGVISFAKDLSGITEFNKGFHDIVLYPPSGDPWLIFVGTVTLEKAITT